MPDRPSIPSWMLQNEHYGTPPEKQKPAQSDKRLVTPPDARTERIRAYHDQLLALQGNGAEPFPHSFAPKALTTAIERYKLVLEPYRADGPGQYDEEYFKGSPVDGAMHKLHLMAEPHHVEEISKVLRGTGCRHKYLSGGDPAQGSLFTVYTGSKTWTDRVAKILSTRLDGLLAKPTAGDEVEYAPNVAGRFTHGRGFMPYGVIGMRGITPLQKDAEYLWELRMGATHNNEALFRRIFERSFQEATRRYGEYFHG